MNYRLYNILCVCVSLFCLLCKICHFFFSLFLKTGKEKCAESARRFRPLKNPIFNNPPVFSIEGYARDLFVLRSTKKKKKI